MRQFERSIIGAVQVREGDDFGRQSGKADTAGAVEITIGAGEIAAIIAIRAKLFHGQHERCGQEEKEDERECCFCHIVTSTDKIQYRPKMARLKRHQRPAYKNMPANWLLVLGDPFGQYMDLFPASFFFERRADILFTVKVFQLLLQFII